MRITRREFSKLGAGWLAALPGLASFLGQPLWARGPGEQTAGPGHDSNPLFLNAPDLKWQPMFPEWKAGSPEIVILHVDPVTHATHLMIRNPVKIQVPRHWHSANETHTVLRGRMVFECDGQRKEQGPGAFNYIPRKMIHQAWLPDDGQVFITVDGAWDVNWVEGPPQPPQS